MKLRPDRKEIRKSEAEERQSAYDELTPKEKIANLDKMFGKGNGAKRQRKRLAK